MTKRAAIYLRISQDRDQQSESPQRQRTKCQAFADEQHWNVIGVYEDRNRSGWKRNVDRPEWNRLMSDVRAGLVDVIMVRKYDRISRQGITFVGELLKLLEQTGCQFTSVAEPWMDTATESGRMIMAVLAEQARAESKNTSDRIRDYQEQAAARGDPHGGGYRQYGYRERRKVGKDERGKPIYRVFPDDDGPVFSIVESEAAVIRECVDRVIRGDSLRGIATDLNRRSIPTSTGGQWYSRSLRNTLLQPRLAGLRKHNDELIRGSWQPIITEDQHRELLVALSKPLSVRRSDGRPPSRQHLLTGIIHCGRCDRYMTYAVFTMANGKRFPRYQCHPSPGETNCGRVAASMVAVDGHVSKELIRFLASVRLRPFDDAGNVDTLEVELSELLEKRTKLNRDHYIRRVIDDDEYETTRRELADEIETLESRIDALKRRQDERMSQLPLGDAAAIESWWNEADQIERKAAIRQAFAKIIIHPAKRRGGNKFDASRVEIKWNWSRFERIADRAELTEKWPHQSRLVAVEGAEA